MSKLQELRAKREVAAKTILQMRDKLSPEKPDFNAEEQAAWAAANKDLDAFDRQIEIFERAETVEKSLSQRKVTVPGAEDVYPNAERRDGRNDGEGLTPQKRAELISLARDGWFLRQFGKPLTAAHKRAAKLTGLNLRAKVIDVRLSRETRAQSVGTPGAGGYLVPTTLDTSLEVALKEWNAVRTVAEVFRTESGNPYDWPMVNDTTNVGTLLAENTTVGAAVDLAFTKATYNAYKFSSGLVLVSAELDQDNAVGLSGRIGALLGERLGRGQEGYFTTGTGTSQPAGIVTGATLGKTGASATAIAASELIDLYHSVDPAYRRDPSFGFMMHDNVAAAVRKLADTTGRFIWEMDIQKGQPATLLGRPVTINQSMASAITTGQKTILAGAFSKMKVRDAGSVRIRRLDERYADIDQIGFIAFMRSDSRVLNAGTNPIKYYAQL